MSERNSRTDPWNDADDKDEAPPRVLTAEEAQALRAKCPPVSPWRVVRAQAGAGGVVALLAGLITGEWPVGLSALYGAAAVVGPGALMAWGVTRRGPAAAQAGVQALHFMVWEMVKILASVAMLVLAPKIVQPLSWPALLVAMVLCLKVYWLALRWRGR